MERYGSGSIRIKKKQCHQTKVGACWLMTSSVVVLCFWQKKKKRYLSYASLAKAGSWNYVYFYQKRIPEKKSNERKSIYSGLYLYYVSYRIVVGPSLAHFFTKGGGYVEGC